MKIKRIIYCFLSLAMFALSGCGPDNDGYSDKVDGNYNMKITPELTFVYEGYTLPITLDVINTTCSITKVDEDGNVAIKIDGVNGVINEMNLNANCSGLGMSVEKSLYDGIMITNNYDRIDCNLTLKNASSTISNSKVLNWNSTVTGSCELSYSGLEIVCDVGGTINFYATYIVE